MEQIYQYFNIKSNNLSKVNEAISSEAGLRNWWTKGTIKKDGRLDFQFNGNYTKSFKVISEKPELIEWECIEGHDDWIGTKIEFKLSKDVDSVNVSFKHYNWAEQSEHFASCNYHWGLYMKSLKSLIETGAGTPHENKKSS